MSRVALPLGGVCVITVCMCPPMLCVCVSDRGDGWDMALAAGRCGHNHLQLLSQRVTALATLSSTCMHVIASTHAPHAPCPASHTICMSAAAGHGRMTASGPCECPFPRPVVCPPPSLRVQPNRPSHLVPSSPSPPPSTHPFQPIRHYPSLLHLPTRRSTWRYVHLPSNAQPRHYAASPSPTRPTLCVHKAAASGIVSPSVCVHPPGQQS